MRSILLAAVAVSALAAGLPVSAYANTPPPPVIVSDGPCPDYYKTKIAFSPVFICVFYAP